MQSGGWTLFLKNYLETTGAGLLSRCRSQAHEDALVACAIAAIDKTTSTVPDEWSGVEALQAARVVPLTFLVNRLLESADLLKKVINAVRGGRPYGTSTIRTMLTEALAEPPPLQLLAQPFPRIWPRIADGLADQAAEHARTTSPLWQVHSLLSLAGFVQLLSETSPSSAAKRINHLATRSILGFRGTATRMPHQVRNGAITDPATAPVAPGSRSIQGHSRFLMEIDNAVGRLRSGAGPATAILDVNAPLPPERQKYSAVMPIIRKAVYLQYDCLSTLFLLFSGIEHIVRSRLSRMGIAHYRADGRPIPLHKFFARLNLPARLRSGLKDVYDASGANIRNRLVHAGYLMIEHCRPKIVDQVLATRRYVRDEHFPENAAEHAAWLLGELSHLWSRGDLDFSWIATEETDTDFELLLKTVPLELDSTQILDHDTLLTVYVTNVAPTLSTLLKLGTVQTLRSPNISLLASLFTMFEGLLRNTMQLMKLPVLHVTPHPEGMTVHTQMMDEDGLLSTISLERLTRHLPTTQQPIAVNYLLGIVRFRNRIAHGNIMSTRADTMAQLGKAIYKLCALMANAGLHHMVSEAAYFRWKQGYVDSSANWRAAEKSVLRDLKKRIAWLPSIGYDE